MKKINRLLAIFLIFLVSTAYSEEKLSTVEELSTVGGADGNFLRIKDVDDINKANVITILALNKITAKSYLYDIEVGKSVKFERLLIQPLFCWKSSPEEIEENKALLKITEEKLDDTDEQIFYGWMFSSSPGLSSLEHSMYDITLVNCN